MKKQVIYLLALLAAFILINGCGNNGDEYKLREGTPAYDLADQLSNTLKYLDPEDNNPLITTKEFKVSTGEVIEKMMQQMGPRANQLTNLDTSQLKTTIDRFANMYAERKLLLNAARAANINITQAQIDSVLSIQYDGAGGQENFEKFIQQRGFTMEEVNTDIEEGLTIQKFVRKSVEENLEITEEDIQSAYEEDKKATVRHILMNTQGKSDSEKAEIKDKMEDIRERAQSGEDFAELAREYSEDPGSKNNGGLYQNIERGQMVEEFDERAFSMPIGEISDVFETQFGYHILTVLERSKETEPFDKVHDRLKNQLEQRKYNDAYQAFMDELKERYEFEVVDYSI